ncbi:MAG: SIS domain-containing protein [Lentisphaerae bacterium]|nr:SIS domain-containing protein [Lentisphaerota bacterium]
MQLDDNIVEYLATVNTAMRAVDRDTLARALDRLETAYREAQGVYIIGNGGSAANAAHLAEDLAKGALADNAPTRFKVLSLADNTSYITAVANDLGYEQVFVFQLKQFAAAGDVLIAVSGSGNSPNVLRAAEWAKDKDVDIIAFTGFDGGKLGKLADIHVHVPLRDMCQAEAVHAVLMHMLVDLLRNRLAVEAL